MTTLPQQMNCPKSLRVCSRPGSCPGCRVHAALQNREELRQKLPHLWEGKPLKATSWEELMGALGISEKEARELECQEQILLDQELARFPKSIQ